MEKELDNPIEEARRYYENAHDVLKSNTTKRDGMLSDSKFVKMAGHTLWAGCLIALNYALQLKPKKNQRLDINDYKAAAAKRDKKLLNYVLDGYSIMHLSMGYDGVKNVNVINGGFEVADKLIERCSSLAPSA